MFAFFFFFLPESIATLLIWNLWYHEHRDLRFEPTLEIYLKMLKMKMKYKLNFKGTVYGNDYNS